MGTRLAALCLVGVAPLACWAQAPAADPAGCNNTPAYSPCELVFELAAKDAGAHPNPYVSVDLRVEFRSPRRRTYAMPAFWDGGRRLVVRFSPTEGGQWDYHVTSNVAEWNDKTGSFSAMPSESPGFLRAANTHHWAYTEKSATGLDQPHLWTGANEMTLTALDDAAFRTVADSRASQKFTHLRFAVLGGSSGFSAPDSPALDYFQRLDRRVRYLNEKGLVADLILAAGPGTLTKSFPSADQRRRFVRFLVARYSAMNVTWQGVDFFEDYPDGRALMKEVGGYLKQFDPYLHPRTTGAHITSTALLDDGWMDFAIHGTADTHVGAIEHQLYPVPFVNVNFGREDSGAGKSGPDDIDATAVRKRLWNATMDGQYPTYSNTGTGPQYANSAGAKAVTVWSDFLSETRYWELEPYFDVDGGRAVALEDTEYIVYIEKPGPIELTVEKHGYDVYWVNPADGERIKDKKKFSGGHFTGQAPDNSHDWLLHVVREGRVASMNKSFKFGSREHDIMIQEIEANTPKVPFAIEAPTTDLSLSKPTTYAAKITRETRATRSMWWLWMGDVAADGQGYRVLATGQKGTMRPPAGIAKNFPAIMHLRLYGMNANGKIYELDAALGINR
jgi:hypothetical protein